ncbi:MAG: FKBP-type peptidyl-prolyl cis-trans isomerase [Chromatiaceae bacterium]|jgi:FKBP-type peptidyl-prolyl cis-trans isomerase FklB
MRITTLLGVAALASSVSLGAMADELKLEDETARINYSLGYQIGGDFKRQGLEMNPAAVTKGIEDALSDAVPLMTPEEIQTTLTELKRKLVAQQKQKAEEQTATLKAESAKFLEENAKQEGVLVTESGLQYQIIEPGTGKTPTPTDKVTVNYQGTLVDGKEFDSSYKRGKPISFKLDGVVKGWTEGLQLIKEGGKIKLFIPPELAYGDRGPLAHRALIFDVELLSVGEPEKAEAEAAPAESKE